MSYSPANPVNFDNLESFIHRHPTTVLQNRAVSYNSGLLTGHYDKAPWSDARVRRALSKLLPRDNMNKSLYHEAGFFGPFFTWPFLFDKQPTIKDLGPNYQYDPQGAKQLPAAAGF